MPPKGSFDRAGATIRRCGCCSRPACCASDADRRQDGAGRWFVKGDPTEGALVVLAAKARLADRSETRTSAPAHRGISVQLRAQAHDDRAPRCRTDASRLHEGRARGRAGALRIGAERQRSRSRSTTPSARAAAGGQRDDGAGRAARARRSRTRSLPPADRYDEETVETRSDVPRARRHDGSAARRGEGGRRGLPPGAHPPGHDHRRPQAHRGRGGHGGRHLPRGRQGADRRRARPGWTTRRSRRSSSR